MLYLSQYFLYSPIMNYFGNFCFDRIIPFIFMLTSIELGMIVCVLDDFSKFVIKLITGRRCASKYNSITFV